VKTLLSKQIDDLKTYNDKPIGVFGARASGKTMFFTSLYALETMQQHNSNIKINCNDFETKEYLKNNYKYLIKGEFPPRTDANNIHKINMTYTINNQKFSLKSIDFAGELLLGVPDEYKNDYNVASYIKKKQELVFNFFANCGGILIFLDPNNDIDESLQRESEILKLLSSIKTLNPLYNSIPISLIITKWDLFNNNLSEDNIDNEKEKAFNYINLHKIYNRIYQNIKSFSKKVDIFPISSSGNSCLEKDLMIKLSNPFNIFSPLLWISHYRNQIWYDEIVSLKNKPIKIKDFQDILEHYKIYSIDKEKINNLEEILSIKIRNKKFKIIILFFIIIILLIVLSWIFL